jgi:ORF6N domain
MDQSTKIDLVPTDGTAAQIAELAREPLVYRGQRVVTLAMIDELHGRTSGTARRNYDQHHHRMTEGKHFFELNQAHEIRALVGNRPQGGVAAKLILLTERGYLMLVKSLNDDTAWDVQEKLVDGYFRVIEPEPEPEPDSILALLDQSERNLVAIRRQRVAFLELEAAHAETRRLAETANVTAINAEQIADAALQTAHNNCGYYSVVGWRRLQRQPVTQSQASQLGKKLTAICESRGIHYSQINDSRWGEVNIYPEMVLIEVMGPRPR